MLRRIPLLIIIIALASALATPAMAAAPPAAMGDPAWDTLMAVVVAIVGNFTVRVLAAVILFDVVTGIAAAWRSKTFQLKRVADFITMTVAPYLMVYGAARLVVLALPSWEPVALFVWAVMLLALSGSIKENWREAFPEAGDLPLPDPPPPHG